MIQSYLIQRLQQPYKGTAQGPLAHDNPFAFGGGLRNGGLTKDAMDILRDIFTFDYMGSAEFEFGAVPAALSRIANSHALTAFSFTVPYTYRFWTTQQDATGSGIVHVLCNETDRGEITDRIKGWAKGSGGRTKESVRLDAALAGEANRTAGWLELDNGYFFFTDKEMFDKTVALFLPETVAST